MTLWQRIATAPKDGTMILLWDGIGRAIGSFDKEFGWHVHSLEAEEFLKPSLWQPLPPMPSLVA